MAQFDEQALKERIEAVVATALSGVPGMADILEERARQLGKGWTLEHDDEHTASEWAWIINIRTNDLLDPSTTCVEWRRLLVEIAAIALAAIQAEDRRHPAGHATTTSAFDPAFVDDDA